MIMKKLFFLLLMLIAVSAVNAQNLTLQQVVQKSLSAMDTKKHCIKGNVSVKVLGKSGTTYAMADGTNSYWKKSDGSEEGYINNGVKYLYNKKKNTVTITKEAYSDVFNADLDISKADFSGCKMELKNGEYIITGKENGAKMTLIIDAKTFFYKKISAKMALASMTITYSNMAYSSNKESLIYKASKFPGAKIVDKRKKK